jgi:hypothetical protein
MVGTPRNQIGGFGELGVAFAHQFSVDSAQVDRDCTVRRTFSGTGLRLGGGANFPIGDLIHLTPFAMLTLGQFTTLKREFDGTCLDAVLSGEGTENEVDLTDGKNTHSLVFVGVGGDFIFGADKPR